MAYVAHATAATFKNSLHQWQYNSHAIWLQLHTQTHKAWHVADPWCIQCKERWSQAPKRNDKQQEIVKG